jgi:hypothetical protein
MDDHTMQEEVFFIGIGDPMRFAFNDNNKLWDTEEEDNEIEEQVDISGINDSYYSDNMDLEAFVDETQIKQNKYKLRKKKIKINKTRRQKTNFLIKLDYDSPCLPSVFCLPTLRSPSKNLIFPNIIISTPSLPQSTIYLGFSQRLGRYGFCGYFGNNDSRNKEYLIENIYPINLNDKLTAHVIALTRIINDNIAQTNNIKVMLTIRNICKTVKRYLKNVDCSPISEQLAENNRYLYQLKLSLMRRGIQLECDFKKSSQSIDLFIACQKSMSIL